MAAHRVLLKPKAPLTEGEIDTLKTDAAAAYLEPLGGAGWYEIKSPALTVSQLISVVREETFVTKAEPDYVGGNTSIIGPPHGVSATRMMIDGPSDMFFSQQWALQNTGQCYNQSTCGIAGYDIKAPQAWSIADSIGRASNVVVVIYGTGVDYYNPDLAGNVWAAPSAYTVSEFGTTYNCPQGAHGFNAVAGVAGCTGQVYDNEGHGTLVAGAVGAVTDNVIGVAGAGDNLTVLPITICAPACDVDSAIRGIDASMQIAEHFRLRLAAASFSHADLPGSALEDEMELATQNEGIVFAASTGNQCSTAGWPAAYHLYDEMAVAASDQDDNPASWGPGLCTDSGGDIAAPGINIYTTQLGDRTGNNPALVGGTSLSAPLVAAAVGLLASACPLPPTALIATIEGTADQKPQLLGYATDGRRLNMGNALASCESGTSATDTVTVYAGGTHRRGGPTDFGAIVISVGGQQICGYGYDTTYDTSASIAQGLVGDCLASPYIAPTYEGGNTDLLTTTAVGPYTNYGASVQVLDECTENCGPAPEVVMALQFSGGSI